MDAVILCSRSKSSRLHKKAFARIHGDITVMDFLLARSKRITPNVILAIPTREPMVATYQDYADKYGITLAIGDPKDVMDRMYMCAKSEGVDWIVRVTHDDPLIDFDQAKTMLEYAKEKGLDYCYQSDLPDGMGVECFTFEALERAHHASRSDATEYISYYLRKPGFNVGKFVPDESIQKRARLTLDYPEDLTAIRAVLSSSGIGMGIDMITAAGVKQVLEQNEWIADINRLPKVTVYICNKDYGRWVDQAIMSVIGQTFQDYELIVVDDGSTDNSLFKISQFQNSPKFRMLTPHKTPIGLASASNRCLEYARGEYIIRLDADDMLYNHAIRDMVTYLDENPLTAIVYPDFRYMSETGEPRQKDDGEKYNHPSCAMIRRSCWNEVKYKEGLRHMDGLDFFQRFSKYFGIGYLKKECFLYRDHENSLSRDPANQEERKAIMKEMGY